MMDQAQLKKILEGALFAAGEPLTVERLLSLFEPEANVDAKQIRTALEEMKNSTEDKAYYLKEVASGFRFQVSADLSPWLIKLWEEKPAKYSKAVLETLVLVAYRQPVTRGDVEEIRGVTSSTHIFKTLLDREWIKVVGHKDVPGKPSLYGTTKAFLDYFNLKNLNELPTLAEVMDLELQASRLEKQLELPIGESTAGAVPVIEQDAISIQAEAQAQEQSFEAMMEDIAEQEVESVAEEASLNPDMEVEEIIPESVES